jgi:predicted MFS family arabinose efflux permease
MSAPSNEEIDDNEPPSKAIAQLVSAKGGKKAWLLSPVFVRLLTTNAMYGYSLASFYLLPKYLTLTFASSPTQIGQVSGIFSLTSLLSLPILIPLLNRFGYRRVSILGYFVCALCALAFPLFKTVGLAMLCARALHGLAASVVFSAGLSLVSLYAPPGKLTEAMGLVGAASLSMGALAPALGEALSAHYGFSPVFLLAAATALLGAALSRDLPQDQNLSSPSLPGSTGTQNLTYLTVLAIIGAGFNVVIAFLAPFALARGFHTVSEFFVSYTLSALIVRIFGGALTQRFKLTQIVKSGILLYGLVMIGIGVLGPGPRVLLGLLFGLAHGALFPAHMALLFKGATGIDRTRLAVLANSLLHLGMMSVFLFGTFADYAGYPSVFITVGSVVCLSPLILRKP